MGTCRQECVEGAEKEQILTVRLAPVSFSTIGYWLLMAGVAGATAYSCIALYGVFRFLRLRRKAAAPPASDRFTPPVSILKPLYGAERGLEENLQSFCRQNYPSYEILFSVREEIDEAVPIVRRLEKTFPAVPMRLLVIGQPRYLNAKVHGLEEMMAAARHEVLVISDSDVRVSQDYLRSVVAPMADPAAGPGVEPKVGPAAGPKVGREVGMVTCISRGVPGTSFWSLLEALEMSIQFVPGVLAAWVLDGMKFSLGPTMVIRKRQVQELGGFARLGDYLADDFLLGQLVAEAGYRVALAENIPDHMVCNEAMGASLRHRLRWERSSRCSRPAGYLGQIFTHSLPLTLLALACAPAGNALAWTLVGACLSVRAVLAWAVGWRLLRDSVFRKYWWLLPAQDLLSFAVWCWAFFGREIVWRGGRFRVLKGGKLEPAA